MRGFVSNGMHRRGERGESSTEVGDLSRETSDHSVLIYFALVFVISWGASFLILGPGGFPLRAEEFESLRLLPHPAAVFMR